MKLPKKISPDPIIDAISEIRFNLKIIQDAFFGIIYNSLKDRYPNTEKLPILKIPETIRNSDINLSIQPHYKIYNDVFNVQIGPKMCSVSKRGEYPGWDLFLEEILLVYSKIKELNIISKINRFGIRYIDFFECNIFENVNLDITVNNQVKRKNKLSIKISEEIENYNMLLQIKNDVEILKEKKRIKGSIIDVDTSLKEINNNFFDIMRSILERAHHIQKEYYFSMLKEDFLKSLNPTY